MYKLKNVDLGDRQPRDSSLANNWSASGRTRHMDVHQKFLRELKEEEILLVKWIPGPTNDADLHTKNLVEPDTGKHLKVYTGKDEYSSMS